jgi:L-ascorbate metabolism protein UlaG (beta-lactamase superfamily)
MNTAFNLIYLGGPTAILEFGGLRIITDPTLDPIGTSFRISETVSETKLAGPAITDPGRIDLVLLSHDQHWDNLDNAGRAFLKTGVKTITTRVGATRLSGNTTGLLPWEQFNIPTGDGDELLITATPARHGPAGTEKITGEVIGFIIQRKSQSEVPVYITGDTVFYDGIGEVARRYQPRYVLFFAGAARPRGPFNVTMNTNDAMDTAFAFPSSIFIPLHFEGWSHYTEGADSLTAAFTAACIEKRLLFPPAGKSVSL